MMTSALIRNKKDTSKAFAPLQMAYFLSDLLFAGRNLEKTRKIVHSKDVYIDLKECNTAEDIFMKIVQDILRIQRYFWCHSDCSMSSSLCNLAVLTILRSAKGGWHDDVYYDFASLMSKCPKVESVDVPYAMDNLATAISKSMNSETFQNMDSQEALKWLQTTNMQAGQMFANFLEKHGHRCVKEFDIYVKPWSNDAIPLVNTLKAMVGSSGRHKKDSTGETTALNNLKVPLRFFQRLLLRILTPFCRNAISYREGSKSVMIKGFDIMRRACHSLADKMVEEGRIPERELLYFLTVHEIYDLLQNRSPKLIQKAIRRKKLHPELDNLQFPEIMVGIPKPINVKKMETNHEPSFTIKGVAVSHGVAKGIARVATSLEEAAKIQPGEILIAYSTDIGWSPYFPMLAGVATELGGLISHGAVVAREYGLPCVVAVHEATRQFRTGDLVVLDGNKGLLERIDQQKEQLNGNSNSS